MINQDEILAQSASLSVHTSHVQRDYVFGWLLSQIYSRSDLSKYLVLKGGNCFRKAYFENARYSPDIDFTTTRPLPPATLAAQLNSVCQYVTQATGVQFETGRTRIDEKQTADSDRTIQKARLYFRDFFGEESEIVLSVRVDISEFDRIHLPIQTLRLVHQYSDSAQVATDIRCLKLEEMLAAKLKCLLQRRHAADLYDFVNAVFVNPIIDVNRSEIVQTFLKMTIFGRGPGAAMDILVNLPVQVFSGYWENYVVCPRDGIVSFDDAMNGFRSTIESLFGHLPRTSGERNFFPAELRNPIMQAGHELTLLRVEYDGIKKVVEPYSLKFKVRKDGHAGEYLYVYDRTGGQSSPPGVKTFLHPKIASIENTDEKFSPRFEVELSKAGEYFGERHFSGRPRSFLTQFGSEKKYTIQCPICGKEFRRKTRDTVLKPHKDSYGNNCYGRTGILQWEY